MKNKNFVSLSMAFAFLALSLTGILLFIKQKEHAFEITHTIFGLTFVGFAIFHIINNWSSLIGYSKNRKEAKLTKELVISLSIFALILAGGLTEVLEPIAEAGQFLGPKRPPRSKQINYALIETNQQTNGTKLKISIEKGKDLELPIATIWIEDSTHKFIESLFVPAKIAKMPESEEEAREGHFDIEEFKPEKMLVWNKIASIKTANFDQETPHENFILHSKTTAKGSFYIMIEIKSNEKSEVYSAFIDKTQSDIFKLKSVHNSLILNGIVEIY